MKLLEQILSEAGADLNYAYTVVPDFGAYFKNVKGITDYSAQKIVLSISKNFVTVEGDNLTIGKFFEGDLLILGKVRHTIFE